MCVNQLFLCSHCISKHKISALKYQTFISYSWVYSTPKAEKVLDLLAKVNKTLISKTDKKNGKLHP